MKKYLIVAIIISSCAGKSKSDLEIEQLQRSLDSARRRTEFVKDSLYKVSIEKSKKIIG